MKFGCDTYLGNRNENHSQPRNNEHGTMNNKQYRNSQKQPYVSFRPKLKKRNPNENGYDHITLETVEITTENHVVRFHVDVNDVNIVQLIIK